MKFDIKYNVARFFTDPNGRKSIISGETEGKSFSGSYADQSAAVRAMYAQEGETPDKSISITSISASEEA
jgi:hypothetical protein